MILLSHDPSHWDGEITAKQADRRLRAYTVFTLVLRSRFVESGTIHL
jgi:hypothetical protein